jgi:hypothetical protein
MGGERLEVVMVSFDERRGYVASHPELPAVLQGPSSRAALRGSLKFKWIMLAPG